MTRKDKIKRFCKIYWRMVVLIVTPLAFLPIFFINNAFSYFYIFLVTAVYWSTDILHPGVISLIPIAFHSITMSANKYLFNQVYLWSHLLDCFSIMMIAIAIEQSKVHRRIALKMLLLFGCSHYRLSFILFFACMFLSMWVTDTVACGLMMPLVKAVLVELERMGILEMYQTIGKAKSKSERHGEKNPRPTDFTVFYFLGIAYSSSIGSMASIVGSHTNQILQIYCESVFPDSPSIEYPHIILLNLPGVLLMETLLYLWMNSYFLGMFRAHSDIALEIGMTEEEAQYIITLLKTQYVQLGRTEFHEIIVGIEVILACILQTTLSLVHIKYYEDHSHIQISSPILFIAILLFVTPINLDFFRFFQTRSSLSEPLPSKSTKSCLNWKLVQDNMNWSVFLVIASSTAVFEGLKESGMADELGQGLMGLSHWPAPLVALVLILCCKLLTEFAPNPCVAYCVLPSIAKLSVTRSMNPHYLMLAAALACSLPFHLITGSPANAMVAAYVHIPHWKMMSAGVGPSLIAMVISWFTIAVWSRAIWTDMHLLPRWVENNKLLTEKSL